MSLQDFFPTVPPPTPEQCILEYPYPTLPYPLPKVDTLDVPYIKEIGIKASLDNLAKHFHCTDYKFNLIQFWFLDIITDCLWRCQDEFQFPVAYQKIIIEWILYIFELIKDPHSNFSRKKFIQVFKEAFNLAYVNIQIHGRLETPREIFSLKSEKASAISIKSEDTDDSSCSSVSLNSYSDSLVAFIKDNEEPQVFQLPKNRSIWSINCVSDVITEKSITDEDEDLESVDEEESINFYRADSKTPSRFLSTKSSSKTTTTASSMNFGKSKLRCTRKKENVVKCPSKLISPNELTTQDSFSVKEDVLKAWFDYNLCQLKQDDMNDSKIGLSSHSLNENISIKLSNGSTISSYKEKCFNFLKNSKNDEKEQEIFVNYCALLVVKEFVQDYFYDSFQFAVIKYALRYNFKYITQDINSSWCVPKLMRGDFRRPAPKKPKKEKKPKKGKKGSKSSKKTKSSKKSKSSKKTKSSKKSKSSKSSKKTKSSKGSKPKKLTKEEKEELKRLKLEQEMLEAERMKTEENRRFMFPLGDAVNDEFFQSIFENWVKSVKKEKKDKKKGKRKGSAKSKSNKSTK